MMGGLKDRTAAKGKCLEAAAAKSHSEAIVLAEDAFRLCLTYNYVGVGEDDEPVDDRDVKGVSKRLAKAICAWTPDLNAAWLHRAYEAIRFLHIFGGYDAKELDVLDKAKLSDLWFAGKRTKNRLGREDILGVLGCDNLGNMVFLGGGSGAPVETYKSILRDVREFRFKMELSEEDKWGLPLE